MPMPLAIASRTFVCTNEAAQDVYNELFINKPKFFTVYAEGDPDAHIFVRFPTLVARENVTVYITQLKRDAENNLVAIVNVGEDTGIQNQFSDLPSTAGTDVSGFPHIVLGTFSGYRIQEAGYIKRMICELVGYRLEAVACADPTLKDFI